MGLEFHREKCILCGICVDNCPFGAIIMGDIGPIATDACTLCGSCVKSCPADAISLPASEEKPKRPVDNSGNVFVYAEVNPEGSDTMFPNVVFELLGKAKRLAKELSVSVSALVVGNRVEGAISLLIGYADEIILCDHPTLKVFDERNYSRVIADVVKEKDPCILLFGATVHGRSLAPRISTRLWTGLTADCTMLSIDSESKNLFQTRPAFGGNIMATIACPERRPQMSTVRPGIFPMPERELTKPVITRISIDPIAPLTWILERTMSCEEKSPLQSADVVVAVGSGAGKKNVEKAKKLCRHLKGALGCTRAVVDAGWLSASYQVGQTGVSVRPKIYIALGISGAVQHVAGMRNSEYIIAVDKNPSAPIFSIADAGIVADVGDVLDALLEKINKPE